MNINTFFDELIDQTNRRGGYPSSMAISDVSDRVMNVVELYGELRSKISARRLDDAFGGKTLEELDYAVMALISLK